MARDLSLNKDAPVPRAVQAIGCIVPAEYRARRNHVDDCLQKRLGRTTGLASVIVRQTGGTPDGPASVLSPALCRRHSRGLRWRIPVSGR
jgi:hypothetical protein